MVRVLVLEDGAEQGQVKARSVVDVADGPGLLVGDFNWVWRVKGQTGTDGGTHGTFFVEFVDAARVFGCDDDVDGLDGDFVAETFALSVLSARKYVAS